MTSPGDFDVRTCIVVEASLDVCNCKVELDLSGWTVSSGDVTDCDLVAVLVIDGIEVENVRSFGDVWDIISVVKLEVFSVALVEVLSVALMEVLSDVIGKVNSVALVEVPMVVLTFVCL